MKKISTLFMGILVALSAVAAPVKMTERAAMEANLPKIEKPVIKAGQFAKFAIEPRFLAAGTDVEGIVMAQAMLNDGIWYLTAMDADTNMVAQFLFYNGKDDAIAGTYGSASKNGVVVYTHAPGDTVSLAGSFAIDYVEKGANYPKYHVYGSNLKDSLNREFDFDFTLEVSAINYMNLLYCMYYGYYCDEVEIKLHDAPVVPTGDTIPLALDDLRMTDKQATAGWWQILGYSADSTVFVTLSNMEDKTRPTAVGTYTFEEIDYAYSYIKADGDKLHFIDGTLAVSMNEDGSYHVAASLLAKDGNVYDLTLNSFPMSENKISIYYANDTLLFMPTNDDPYFFFIETKASYDEYEDDFKQASLNEEVDSWIEYLAGKSAVSDFVLQGNVYLLMSDFFGEDLAAGEYVALAAPIYNNSVRNGDASYLLFEVVLPEGVENVEAKAVKAVKFLRNGQLIIRKNGAEYNAFGTLVK